MPLQRPGLGPMWLNADATLIGILAGILAGISNVFLVCVDRRADAVRAQRGVAVGEDLAADTQGCTHGCTQAS